LDVGCGGKPSGDVNVDLYIKQRDVYGKYERKDNPIFKGDIVTDAHNLPFRERSFNEVYSSHLIEHLGSPSKFLRECERVAIRRVIVVCPSRWMKGHRGNPFHKWTMTRKWFAIKGYSTSISWRFYGIGPIKVARVDEITATRDIDGRLKESSET
jgi:hypothetical protein